MTYYSICDPRELLPAGEYYIGDPCYVIKDDEWSDCLDGTHYFGLLYDLTTREYRPSHMQNGVFLATYKDMQFKFAGSSTKYGDGCYPVRDDEGNELGECGVDAGLIAAIPVSMIETCGEKSGLELGVIHEFGLPFSISYDDGVIKFGRVKVITCDEDEVDEYDYY